MIYASDGQTRWIAEGRPEYWNSIALPVGPQPIPRWALGMAVNWNQGYANAPSFVLKVPPGGVTHWPDMRWTKNGALYLAEHLDGRAQAHYHNGAISMTTLVRKLRHVDGKPDEPVTYEALATTQQGGLGGLHIPIVMGGKGELRGKTVVLRGPWHGAAPAGYTEVSTHPWPPDPRILRWMMRRRDRPARRALWEIGGGDRGTLVRESVFLRLFARFLPHLELVRATWNGVTAFEPLAPGWDRPKRWMLRERPDETWGTV